MEAAMVPQVAKREFLNQTNGWVGVVVLDPRGEERGVNVEPGGTVWLSEAEVILTARAPRLPEDNPFEEQTFVGIDEYGQRQEFKMRPLVPADTDPRYVPTQERYTPPPPATEAHAAVQANAAARDEVVTSPEAAAREKAILAAPPVQGSVRNAPTPAPTGAAAPPSTGSQALQNAAAPPAASEEAPDERPSWTEPPPAPGQVLPGALQGTNEPSPEAGQAQASDPTAPPAGAAPPPQPPVPPQPPTAPPMTATELAGGIRDAEEHAATVDPQIGEETGAAKPPAGSPVEGEFAQAEEVGSPDAPAQADDTTQIGG